MELVGPKYIGKPIIIKTLRDFILDTNLTDRDTIVIHYTDFSELTAEYYRTYKQGMPSPYLLLGVLIKQDTSGLTSRERIVVIENDTESKRTSEGFNEGADFYEVVFRCGWCGNIVDYDGSALRGPEWCRKDNLLRSRRVTVINVTGYCCPHERQPIPTHDPIGS